ncbi:S-adenosyl-L-methionine-dependent methyltransferase [Parasponia andersonii]|uniref:S-adenosyl-L-methionine-dependent methyltransferase n=1 Tax=Parasponia andersonii TaxID=3476 RepID=A0A2P5BU35_PARAD|nr:S-adenosyl-L-methionine-dependent methyltransferase [Parasponia andersonii]
MSIAEVEQKLTPKSSLDLVTIAQALHWFDLPNFYEQVKWALKKPNGIVAAWCYTLPRIDSSVDPVLDRCYSDSHPYWDPARKLVEGEYRGIDFPFEPVDGTDDTGPFRFVTERSMDFEEFLMYLKSWSAYQTAKDKGVELLEDHVVEGFKGAWKSGEGGDGRKAVKFPVFLRIGKVGEI